MLEPTCGRGRQREHRVRIAQQAAGLDERRTLGVVGRRMLETDQVVERRDQFDDQRLPVQRHGELGRAVLVGAMRVLRVRSGWQAGGSEQGQQRGEAGE